MAPDRRDDARLIEAAKRGEIPAFETLVRTHSGAVYGHAMRFFGDTQAAEEVVQEVFVKVYRSLGGFDGQAAFSTWLFRVTRNVCLDMLRAGRRRPVPVDPVYLIPSTAPDHAPGVIDTVMVEEAMRALPPEDREALSAVTLFGMSYAEASEELKVPVGTVKSRVFRARRTLLATLGLTRGEQP